MEYKLYILENWSPKGFSFLFTLSHHSIVEVNFSIRDLKEVSPELLESLVTYTTV